MSIKAICNSNVVTMERGTTLKEASDLMQRKHVGSIVVTEVEGGKKIPCGIITDRDIALAVGSSIRPQDLRVEQIMRNRPVTAKGSDGIYDTIMRMRDNGVKRLPVVNADGSLCGVICADDLLSMMGDEINSLAKITEVQIKKERGLRAPVEMRIEM